MRAEIENEKKLSFLEVYRSIISPKLKEIDLLIKTSQGNFSMAETAEVLELQTMEIKSIMSGHNLKEIDKQAFFTIMYYGSSYICTLYHRELDCGSPYTYTRSDISYIYNLDQAVVNEVCDSLKITEATAFTLPEIFAAIQIL